MATAFLGFAVAEAGEAISLAELHLALIVDTIGTAIITVGRAIEYGLTHHKPHPSTSSAHGTSDGGAMDVDDHYFFESPCLTPDTIMNPVNKRSVNPIETPKPKRVYEEVDNKHDRDVKFTGPSYTVAWCRDFSAIQRTRVNPVTGRIIGYKGIPRKRRLSPTSKYSSFWRAQKHAKTSFHAARSPGVWDSARR